MVARALPMAFCIAACWSAAALDKTSTWPRRKTREQAICKRKILFFIFRVQGVTIVFKVITAIAVPVIKFTKKKLSRHSDDSAHYGNQVFSL
jgi:hypothetical protein